MTGYLRETKAAAIAQGRGPAGCSLSFPGGFRYRKNRAGAAAASLALGLGTGGSSCSEGRNSLPPPEPGPLLLLSPGASLCS